jgi:hypothetical protein
MLVAGTGFERPSKNTGNSTVDPQGGAESGALGVRGRPIDPELAAVVDAWPTLPAATRSAILAMIRGVG